MNHLEYICGTDAERAKALAQAADVLGLSYTIYKYPVKLVDDVAEDGSHKLSWYWDFILYLGSHETAYNDMVKRERGEPAE